MFCCCDIFWHGESVQKNLSNFIHLIHVAYSTPPPNFFKPGFIGTDTFVYRVYDGEGGSDTATVTINVNSIGNNPPDAVDDTFSTDEGTNVNEDLLINDSDPDGNPLTVETTPVSGPSNGSLTLTSGGSFVYAPNAGTLSVLFL